MRRILAALIAAALLVQVFPSTALAIGFLPLPPKPPLELKKPALPAHADAAPDLDGVPGVVDSAPATGAVDPAEMSPPDPAALAAEDAAALPVSHPLDLTSSTGSNDVSTANLDGRNNITFARFWDGDIVVVLDPWFSAGHAGIFDKSWYTGDGSYAVISANRYPANGVQRERCLKFRAYDRAYGLGVPVQAHHRTAVRMWAARQMGKPYSITIAKGDTRSFYCSKLVWCAWYYVAGVDLDGDGGWFVWPVDLINSPLTILFGYWN